MPPGHVNGKLGIDHKFTQVLDTAECQASHVSIESGARSPLQPPQPGRMPRSSLAKLNFAYRASRYKVSLKLIAVEYSHRLVTGILDDFLGVSKLSQRGDFIG